MKKKVMYIVQSAGGVERYIQMLLKYCDKNLYENILVCSYDYKRENYENLVSGFYNVEMCREINLLTDIKAILMVRSLIKKVKPDIIYVHSSKGGAIGRIANLGIKNDVIYNPHGWAFCMECSQNKKKIYRIVEKILSRVTDKIIAISECEKTRALTNKICLEEKIEVILNGIDVEEYDNKLETYKIKGREELNIPIDSYVIGLVGRICYNKAPEIFLKAAYEIKKKIPDCFFILVGDGPERNNIEKLIDNYGLSNNVLITGWVDNPLDYIYNFNQGMLLTRWEGFGLVLAEYMVANVPVIATNIDSIPEIIVNEYNGLLVEINNVEQIIEACREFIIIKILKII